MVILYSFSQIVLVFRNLDEKWGVVDIIFGLVFYLASIAANFAFSTQICDMSKHYVDGMFIGNICSLLAVMMVYKYFDGITREDLEFAVGERNHEWNIKDPLLSDSAMAQLNNDYGTKRS